MTAMFFVESHIHAGRDRGEERHGADFALADMLGKHDWKGWACPGATERRHFAAAWRSKTRPLSGLTLSDL
jgi:hypothetical protein